MHTFQQSDGTTTTCDKFMQAPRLKEGYEWVNVSELGSGESIWVERVQVPISDDRIFGYRPDDLLAMQYR